MSPLRSVEEQASHSAVHIDLWEEVAAYPILAYLLVELSA